MINQTSSKPAAAVEVIADVFSITYADDKPAALVNIKEIDIKDDSSNDKTLTDMIILMNFTIQY